MGQFVDFSTIRAIVIAIFLENRKHLGFRPRQSRTKFPRIVYKLDTELLLWKKTDFLSVFRMHMNILNEEFLIVPDNCGNISKGFAPW
jgi:hypothetical protein